MRSNSGDFMPKRNSSISLRMLIAASLGPAALPAIDAVAQDYTTWRSYAGGAHSSQYSALDQINKSNVHRLEVAWKDRKSTRLNSSHVRISYAVFCLKKKKN